MMKITKYIPDSITSMNLLCGVLGIVFAFRGRADIAFPLMLAGAFFDFCDGLTARALDAYSELGKELDSLSDIVTFGVLPSVMLYNLMQACALGNSLVCWIPLLIAVFSGIRLAKFNVDDRQHMSFLGLPTPMNALLCASLCYYVSFTPDGAIAMACCCPATIPALTVAACVMLVCELPMFSMKFSREDTKTLKWKRISFMVEVAIIIALVLVLGKNWSLAVFFACALYIIKNIIYGIFGV